MKLFQIPVRVFSAEGHLTLFNATVVLPASSSIKAKKIIAKKVEDKSTPIGSAIAGFDKSCSLTIDDPEEIKSGIYFHDRGGIHG